MCAIPFAVAAAAVGAAGAIGAGVIGAEASKSAASAQANAANNATAAQLQMFNQTQANEQPFITGGGNALTALQSLLGIGPGGGGATNPILQALGIGPQSPATPGAVAAPVAGAGGLPAGYQIVPTFTQTPGDPTQFGGDSGVSFPGQVPGPINVVNGHGQIVQTFPAGTTNQAIASAFATPGAAAPANTTPTPTGGGINPATFQGSPGYNFQRQQGLNAVTNSAAASGGLGGNAMKALQSYGTGLANQDWYNYLSALSGGYNSLTGNLQNIATLGQNAAGNLGTNATAVGGQIGNNIIGAGNAQASGIVGGANALGGALSGVGNNALLGALLYGQQGGMGAGAPAGYTPTQYWGGDLAP